MNINLTPPSLKTLCFISLIENIKRTNRSLESLKGLLIQDLWIGLTEFIKQPKTLKEICIQRAISHLKRNPANRDFKLNSIRKWAWGVEEFWKFRDVLLQYENKAVEVVVLNFRNQEFVLHTNSQFPLIATIGDILCEVSAITNCFWQTVYLQDNEWVKKHNSPMWKIVQLDKRLSEFDFKPCDKVVVCVDLI